MSEEEKKTILGDLFEKLSKAQSTTQHQSVLDHTEKSNYYTYTTNPYILMKD